VSAQSSDIIDPQVYADLVAALAKTYFTQGPSEAKKLFDSLTDEQKSKLTEFGDDLHFYISDGFDEVVRKEPGFDQEDWDNETKETESGT
jgi:hypothetical protein